MKQKNRYLLWILYTICTKIKFQTLKLNSEGKERDINEILSNNNKALFQYVCGIVEQKNMIGQLNAINFVLKILVLHFSFRKIINFTKNVENI